MKRVALVCLLAAGAAAQAETYVDHARVRSVEPQYENVQVPRNQCSTQQVIEQRPVGPVASGPNLGGVLIGGVAGAVLGNQVGKGHGREAATAVGAVAGAMIGDRVAGGGNRGGYYEPVARDVTTCRTVNEVQPRLVGYRVSYDYRGRQYDTMTRQDPGSMLPVRVSVEPVEEAEYHPRRP